MKRTLLISLWLLKSIFGFTQTFDVEAILYNGNINQHINIVILSDGYLASELSKFEVDAENFTNALFDTPPYQQYKNFFNVYIIKVPSNESGASHPGSATDISEPAHPVSVVDTYFGATFDTYGIHRLLVPQNRSKITHVLANNFPSYDQVVILVNSPYYGGSGGAYATASLHPSSTEIAIHELGHSFAFLRDEYWAGNSYAVEAINMTQETDPAKVRWKNWYNDAGVGIYQHCCGGSAASWYKPHQNCKMEKLGVPFCAVCSEGTVERIHALTNPIADYSPKNTTLSAAPSLAFSLDLILPVPNTLVIDWQLNGKSVAANAHSLQLSSSNLKSGNNVLTAVVRDLTAFVRESNPQEQAVYGVSWTIENSQSPPAFPDPDKWYVIKNKFSGLNLRNDDCNNAPQTYAELYHETGECTQWRFIKNGNNWNIQNRASGLYIRNDDCKTENDKTLIELWKGTGSCAQWQLLPAPTTGYYHLRNVRSNLNIRNEDCGNISDQTRVELYDGTGNCAQWKLIAVGDINPSPGFIAENEAQVREEALPQLTASADAFPQKGASINVYPNPSYGRMNIDYGGQGLEEITLTDLSGRTVLHVEVPMVRKTQLDIQGLPAGMYLIHLTGTQGAVIRRVMIGED